MHIHIVHTAAKGQVARDSTCRTCFAVAEIAKLLHQFCQVDLAEEKAHTTEGSGYLAEGDIQLGTNKSLFM